MHVHKHKASVKVFDSAVFVLVRIPLSQFLRHLCSQPLNYVVVLILSSQWSEIMPSTIGGLCFSRSHFLIAIVSSLDTHLKTSTTIDTRSFLLLLLEQRSLILQLSQKLILPLQLLNISLRSINNLQTVLTHALQHSSTSIENTFLFLITSSTFSPLANWFNLGIRQSYLRCLKRLFLRCWIRRLVPSLLPSGYWSGIRSDWFTLAPFILLLRFRVLFLLLPLD